MAVVGLFTGMVLGLQLYYTLIKFGSVGAVGAAISLTIIRELGPVLTAIMITAPGGFGNDCGNRHSADLGTNRRPLYHADRPGKVSYKPPDCRGNYQFSRF